MSRRKVPRPLDFGNRAVVADWLEGLRLAFDEIDDAVTDMLRPPRRREPGPALHAEHYRAARAQVADALAYAGARAAPRRGKRRS